MKSIAFLFSVSVVTSAFRTIPKLPQHQVSLSVMSAVSPYSGWGASSSSASRSAGVPSKTARESACNVEWEPMSELERRIEDGLNYEHLPNSRKKKKKNRHAHQRVESDVPSARGVFCGYTSTDEDISRLKSADPDHQ